MCDLPTSGVERTLHHVVVELVKIDSAVFPSSPAKDPIFGKKAHNITSYAGTVIAGLKGVGTLSSLAGKLNLVPVS